MADEDCIDLTYQPDMYATSEDHRLMQMRLTRRLTLRVRLTQGSQRHSE